MREHKYRGKRVDNGEWAYGDRLSKNDKVYIVIDFELSNDYDEGTDCYLTNWFEVIPETVGEYTGLPDMYKDEIFDGDILYEPSTDNYYTVIFDEGCFYALLDDDVLIQLSEINGSAETIGSIHDMEVQK